VRPNTQAVEATSMSTGSRKLLMCQMRLVLLDGFVLIVSCTRDSEEDREVDICVPRTEGSKSTFVQTGASEGAIAVIPYIYPFS